MGVLSWQGSLRIAALCAQKADKEQSQCFMEHSAGIVESLLRRWRPGRRTAQHVEQMAVDLVIGSNETGTLLQALTSRAEHAMLDVQSSSSSEDSIKMRNSARAAGHLAGLALEFGRLARLLVDHSRTVWGVKQLAIELSGVYPNIQQQFPALRMQTGIYGRHWDVLERLLAGLERQRQGGNLRMAELGVACGPIGLHLLARFPQLHYFGADPTIKQDVWDAYKPYQDRAQLFATTSEDMHGKLENEAQFDLIFVDGPHTYANVRRDLELWEKRVRPGGIIAGHDFTIAHPPLLWAVLEYRLLG